MDEQQLDLTLRRLVSLPTFPSVVWRVLPLTSPAGGNSHYPIPLGDDLLAILRCDVSLTAGLISLANRSGAGRAHTVQQAADELGPEAVRSAALAMRLLPSGREGLDPVGFWRHCLAVALAGEALARQIRGVIDPQEVFVCGLLHDVGKLALDVCLPKTYGRVLDAARVHMGNISVYERQIVGMDHAVVGRRLAQRWRLGGSIQQVIWLAHQPIEAIPASVGDVDRLTVAVVNLADTLARERNLGFSGNFELTRSSGQLARQLGLGEDVLLEVADALADQVESHGRMLGLDQDTEPPARQVLSDANVELGRINEDLRSHVEHVRQQAEAFGHFREFISVLEPEATVCQLLTHTASVIAAAGGLTPSMAEPIVAYAVGDADTGVLAVRDGGTGDPLWRSFARRDESEPSLPDPPAATDAMGRLLRDVWEMGEWLDTGTCRHHPLICRGSWVGGVLYPRSLGSGQHTARRAAVIEALREPLGMACWTVHSRGRAMRLSEQLAGASQVLAATQDALAEAKTLSAMGEMAAGAAHEMNNPLAVISGRAQLMAERHADQEDRQTWRLIADQAQRISDTITELMEFASPPEPQRSPLRVEKLLEDALNAFRGTDHLKAKAARVDIHCEEDVPQAMADRRQMRAVIAELLANAATASNGQPHIRVSAEADEVNDAVLLTVRDNGPGMDQQVLASVFTPFFSSQQAGRRRGLGLPRAKRYVENNGGRIWIRSQETEGTTVYVQLPRVRG